MTVVHSAIIKNQCTELRSGCNKITSQGTTVVADFLNNNTRLESLNLFHNKILDQNVCYLINILSLSNSNFKMLFLGDNQITDRDAQYLATMLKKNQVFIYLMLSTNEISDQDVAYIAHAFTHHNATLKELYFLGNQLISDTCIDKLGDMLVYNHTLYKLVLFD